MCASMAPLVETECSVRDLIFAFLSQEKLSNSQFEIFSELANSTI